MLKPLLLSILIISCNAISKDNLSSMGKIEVLDPSFKKIIDPSAKIEKLAEGLTWAEGPVWINDGHYLLFSDPTKNTIFQWSEKNGLQEFLNPSGYEGNDRYSDEPGTNGLIVNNEGFLIACDHGNRRIAKISMKTKMKESFVDHWGGKRFNSPNDICQHSNGDYYFTDPPYGLPGREKDTINREIKANGVYRINSEGEVFQIISNLDRPNGIAISEDGMKLYVALSSGENPYIMSYNIQKDGAVGEGEIFFNFRQQFPDEPMAADGIKVDKNGNVYAAAGDGVIVINNQGKSIGRIRPGVHTANCNFGDGFLYMTSKDQLFRVKLK